MIFSERTGIVKPRDAIQIKSIDEPLKNKLWNIISESLFSKAFEYHSGNHDYTPTSLFSKFLRDYWHSFLKKTTDTIPEYKTEIIELIKLQFFKAQWYSVFDLIEYVIQYSHNTILVKDINQALEEEKSAYRIVNYYIVETTSEEEIMSIEETIKVSSKFPGVNEHIQTALKLLSSRVEPDYRNSIKESISAVECICKQLVDSDSDELGKSLKKIEEKYGLHGALKAGFSSIYGYTSDADGIRHAMMDLPNLSFVDAYFFFIICSAFINYLIMKIVK